MQHPYLPGWNLPKNTDTQLPSQSLALYQKFNPQMKKRWITHQSLTAREREVLLLIVSEKISHEIAIELGISKGTVENHRRSIIRKTKIRHVAGLVKFAIRQGWVEAYYFKNTPKKFKS
ncbi:MAG: LuxR C-terminal-related transcriptional regulator [Bacteroidia bacterium]|nr:LuxR C-terminal-related transcriptional regulator [Bacteroidia bacterium]